MVSITIITVVILIALEIKFYKFKEWGIDTLVAECF